MKIINLTDERDEKFEQLKKLGIELFVPIAETHYRLLVENPGEEPVQINSRAHTWTRNYYNAIAVRNLDSQIGAAVPDAGVGFGAGSLRVKQHNGTVVATASSTCLNYQNTSANDYFGILLGTDDTAYSIEDYKLGAVIAHGTGSGQMSYNPMIRVDPVYDSGDKKWSLTVKRIINNNSGGTIVVKEIELGGGSSTYTGNQMACRDVLASPVSVGNGGQLTVEYIISMTFPA